jgi:5-methylcytosine-specific restriction endonuclease McrA
MSYVFVVDHEKRPLNPVHPGWARKLLTSGQAAVFRHHPFTLILEAALPDAPVHPLRLKLDPGSRTTGLALVNDTNGQVVFAAEIVHRGQQVKAALDARRAVRRSRRRRKTRYRPARFLNRRRPKGWLPPSLESRLANVTTWVTRLQRLCPITALSQELVKFDLALMQQPTISGIEYQQGELADYECREYLLEKWQRRCAYCGATNVPLEVEHLTPRSRGGSDRLSNLVLACHACNQRKGTQTAEEYGFPQLQAQARLPLKDAAAVNATRWALYERLQATGLPVETGSGGLTKYNRILRGLPKTHWCDAVCVGRSTPAVVSIKGIQPLLIEARGHGNRQMCGANAAGFPIRHRTRQKRWFGYQTGDLVRAVIPRGTHVGKHTGRVTIRARPSFRLNGIDVHPRYLTLLQKGDGYEYSCVGGA